MTLNSIRLKTHEFISLMLSVDSIFNLNFVLTLDEVYALDNTKQSIFPQRCTQGAKSSFDPKDG